MALSVGKAAALWKFRALLKHPAKLAHVLRDSRTPMMARLAALAAVVYVFLPFDIAPDLMPFAGQIDDAAILFFLASLSLRMIPDEVFKSVGLSNPER
jgi:uncharacterized membrane protein YkvA (DUF1232 family)